MKHVLPEDRIDVDQRFKKAVEAQTGWNIECRIRRTDGVVRWIWAAGEHQCDASGKTHRMAGIIQDITQRKLAEEELIDSQGKLRQALEDRERLSRDLHDNVIQAVYAVGMQLEMCQRLPVDNTKIIAKHLTHAISGLNGVIKDVRGYISGTGRQVTVQSGLMDGLSKLVYNVSAAGSLRICLKVDPLAAAGLIPIQVEQVLQIAREALSNVLKHSGARQGKLSLRREGNRVCLEVSDDGIGFEQPGLQTKGSGLRNMESRGRQMGANLRVFTSPGQGTRIVVVLPQT